MFEKLKKIFKNREEKEKHNYDLTFDNVAIQIGRASCRERV